MAVLHISEADAVRDFAGVLARVRAGEEVVIGLQEAPIAVLKPAVSRPGRLLSESIRIAGSRGDEGSTQPLMDSEFAADMQDIVRERKPRSSAWD